MFYGNFWLGKKLRTFSKLAQTELLTNVSLRNCTLLWSVRFFLNHPLIFSTSPVTLVTDTFVMRKYYTLGALFWVCKFTLVYIKIINQKVTNIVGGRTPQIEFVSGKQKLTAKSAWQTREPRQSLYTEIVIKDTYKNHPKGHNLVTGSYQAHLWWNWLLVNREKAFPDTIDKLG